METERNWIGSVWHTAPITMHI